MLHIVSRSPFSSTALADCLNFAQANSIIILIAGGVYATQHELLSSIEHLKIYALADDIDARGLGKTENIEFIDYSQMVALTEVHHPIQTWS